MPGVTRAHRESTLLRSAALRKILESCRWKGQSSRKQPERRREWGRQSIISRGHQHEPMDKVAHRRSQWLHMSKQRVNGEMTGSEAERASRSWMRRASQTNLGPMVLL